MLKYVKLSKKPKTFRTFTGLTIEEFDDLYTKIETKCLQYETKRLYREDRKRAVGAGRKFKLDLIDRLLMLMVYYRLYITYCLSGFLFDLDQSNVCRNIKHIEPLVKACIPLPERVYKKTRRTGDIDELLEYFPEMKVFIDATEQEIPRPKNKRRRKNYYSGKKKRHTVKTQIMVNKKGVILHKTRYVNGKKHDYTLFKKKPPPPLHPNVEVGMDLGYLGAEKDNPNLKVNIPVKKKKGKELSKKDKRHNKRLRKERVVVEHTIGRMKKFGIMGNAFRNRLKRYDNMVSIVSGLVNFRLMNCQDGFDLSTFIG
ncbi:MAG: transposase [Thermoplasmatales archaeon]|nr:transposase [Thermoplasmatales archaeon]